jgi:hypothetical protein
MAVLGSSSPIKSIQRGITLNGSTTTAVNVTITAVDLDKSFVSSSCVAGWYDFGGDFAATSGAQLTSSTNLAITAFPNLSTTTRTYWEVIEYV